MSGGATLAALCLIGGQKSIAAIPQYCSTTTSANYLTDPFILRYKNYSVVRWNRINAWSYGKPTANQIVEWFEQVIADGPDSGATSETTYFYTKDFYIPDDPTETSVAEIIVPANEWEDNGTWYASVEAKKTIHYHWRI